MATKTPKIVKTAPARTVTDEREETVTLVNPHGIMHVVSLDHARVRLKKPGWRPATPEERAALKAAGGNQRWDRPLVAPWNPEPEPDPDPEIDEE